MNQEELEKYIGTENISLMEAMQKIDRNAKGILYILNGEGRLCGSLTDGDIRRWILKSGNLSETAGKAMFQRPRYLLEEEAGRYMDVMESASLSSVPVVNKNREILDIFFRDKKSGNQIKSGKKALHNIPVIIMAGGKGTRLYPYTKVLPKPLIPIGEVPILERIFNRLFQFGADEFFLTVNYKKEMIKSYFAELNPPYGIRYVEEEKPLGTAGSIRLIEKAFDRPVLITNCDILIDIDYENLLDYHNSSGNQMTVVSSLKNISIPYGVLHAGDQGRITSMEEKPKLSCFINTGMYLVNPQYLGLIPADQVFHMTDLAAEMLKAGEQVGMYPIRENAFLDMGELEEMKKMEERIQAESAE